jgi:anti-sigma B factor antagonist
MDSGGNMTIQSERIDKSTLELSLIGRLDTATAPQLERKLKQFGDEIAELVLDFTDLTYISSMGLRVLLQTQKTMNAQGRRLVIKNMNASIREVFEMTGFINLMVQEEKFVVIRKEEGQTIILSLIGQMSPDSVSILSGELASLREAKQGHETLAIALDAAKLTVTGGESHPSGSAAGSAIGVCKLLRQAIEDTAWPGRKLSVVNVPPELRANFENAGMESLLDSEK